MKITVIIASLAFISSVSTTPALAANGGHGGGHSGGGHSGGGQSGGGHSGGGHSGGGHSGGHSTGGSAAGTHAGDASHGSASHSRAATPSRTASGQHAPPPPAARPRGTEPIVGTAVPRASVPRDLFLASPSTYAPHFGSSFVGFGIHARPFVFGHRFSYPVCWGLLDCAPPLMSTLPYVPSAPPVETEAEITGYLRLDVQPLDAQIFVDGYFTGTVMDFFQFGASLNLPAGPHHLEFRAPDYETLAVDVQIQPNRTITYRAGLKRIRSGVFHMCGAGLQPCDPSQP